MADNHGSSPAAWTAVVLVLVGFMVGAVGMLMMINWVVFGIGCAIVVLGGIVGKVMAAAGLGSH